MEFIRARSNAQKNMRLQQICEASIELFDTKPYEKITLASIARKLDFSRGNLYKYVSTKEEIFLNITMQEIDNFFQDIIQTFDNKSSMKVEEFALLWAKTLFRHERLLKLCSILFSTIEKNVTVESLADFKKQLFIKIENLYPLLKQVLPDFPEEAILIFLDYQLYQIAGLYPSITLTEFQREAIQISGVPYEAKGFVTVFSEFLTTLLIGLSQRK